MADNTAVEHTAGRLEWDGTDILDEACNEVVSIEQGQGYGLGGASLILTDANARRLVASWNACKGIETETLEEGPLVELQDRAGVAEARADAAEALLEEAREIIRRQRKFLPTAAESKTSAFLAKLEARATTDAKEPAK